MSPELGTAIAQAYRVFGRYRIGRDLIVCHCPCCMTPETERKLAATPLRDIPSRLLAEYTNSAHGYDDGRIADELRYFLPRYLELIAAADPPDAMGLDICLRRLGHADYRQKWESAETEVIDRFFDAFLRARLSCLELERWPVGWRVACSVLSVLTLAVTAGGDIGRLLDAWGRAPDPAAVAHMAELRRYVYESSDRTYLYSPFLEDHETAANAIGAWLVRPAVSARIEAAFFAATDPRLQGLLSDALPNDGPAA